MVEKKNLREGGCLCGRIRYRVTGEPRWVAHCHCRSCQLATGAAFATYAGFVRQDFDVRKGVPTVANSSPGVSRCFCPHCGTALTYESERWPGEVHIFVATLDDPEALRPQVHVNVAEKLAWISLDDGLPQKAGFTDGDD